MQYIWGVVTGILFGALLQRSRVVRYDKQLGALRLKDMTIIKFMLSAIVVGAVGVHLLVGLDQAALHVKSFNVGGVVLGGLLFGLGWGLCGYCPGTAAGAVGEGRLDGLWTLLGMLAGAAVYAELYPALKASVLAWADLGKLTLGEALGVGPWPIIVALALVSLALFRWLERIRL